MNRCELEHRRWEMLEQLPIDQGGSGRHKCCGCAYERGYNAGLVRSNKMSIDLDTLPTSQAGPGRHRSPHAAFAMGYFDGVNDSYR